MAKHPHTPGPWNLDEDDLTIFADVGTAICEINDVEDFPCVEEGTEEDVAAECRANALLISAAPDLLEALGLLHAHLFGPTPAMPRHEIDARCRAALVKAEGK